MKSKMIVLSMTMCAGLLMPAIASADIEQYEIRVRDFSATHVDFEADISQVETGIVETQLGPDGKPVYAGGSGTISTHGEEAFNQWYNDTPGVNLGMNMTLGLDSFYTINPEIYTYDNPEFFIIDNTLMENEGNDHNYHYTVELHTQGKYRGGEKLWFAADDDLWVFINGELVADIGGVHRARKSVVDMDAVAASQGLSIGDTFDYDLFYAERHSTQAYLHFDVPAVPAPGAMSIAALSILGCAGVRRRRNDS